MVWVDIFILYFLTPQSTLQVAPSSCLGHEDAQDNSTPCLEILGG